MLSFEYRLLNTLHSSDVIDICTVEDLQFYQEYFTIELNLHKETVG